MPLSFKAIQELVKAGAYNVDNIPELEAYVLDDSSPYFAKGNRTLAKLYQNYPSESKPAVVARILLLAVLQFPSTDILSLKCLIPESAQKSDEASKVLHCADLLESCQFVEFWKEFEAIEGAPPTGSDQLRLAILQTMALTYRSAPIEIVLKYLNTQKLPSSPLIEKSTSSEVVFVAAADNTKRTTVFQKGVNFSEISNVLAFSQ